MYFQAWVRLLVLAVAAHHKKNGVTDGFTIQERIRIRWRQQQQQQQPPINNYALLQNPTTRKEQRHSSVWWLWGVSRSANQNENNDNDNGNEQTMFDRIVGDHFDSERAAVEECGGDTSFLDYDPQDDNNNNNNNEEKQELRDKEMEEILEHGGDLSFYYDSPPPLPIPSTPPHQESTQTTAFDAIGGDPASFVMPGDDTPKKVDFKRNLDGEGDHHHNNNNNKQIVSSFISNFAQQMQSNNMVANPMQGNLHTRGDKEDEDYYFSNDEADDDMEVLSADFLEAMGGDPSFLQDAEESHNDMLDEIAEMGGDPSFLDGFVQPERMETSSTSSSISISSSSSSISSSSSTTSSEDMRFAPGELDDDMTTSKSIGPYHTAVEGEMYSSKLDELEALGGDPFFLENDVRHGDVDDENETSNNDESCSQTPLVAAPDPSFLLNYVGKQQQQQQQQQQQKQEYTMEKEGKEIDSTAVGGEYYDDESSLTFQQELERAEIEEMGGDASFL